jgi:hypothetical protein
VGRNTSNCSRKLLENEYSGKFTHILFKTDWPNRYFSWDEGQIGHRLH